MIWILEALLEKGYGVMYKLDMGLSNIYTCTYCIARNGRNKTGETTFTWDAVVAM